MDCPECGEYMILKKSKYGFFWSCHTYPKCNGSHGAHPDGTPLGIPANKETKEWRIKAHNEFDKLWKSKGYKRSTCYRLLQELMDMTPDEAHIGRFNINQCKTLIKILEGDDECIVR